MLGGDAESVDVISEVEADLEDEDEVDNGVDVTGKFAATAGNVTRDKIPHRNSIIFRD